MSSIPNGLVNSEFDVMLELMRLLTHLNFPSTDQSLLNIDPRYGSDPRYAAMYANPYLKQPHSPLVPSHTANPAVTPNPPPYQARGSNSNSSCQSFSSSTTISNMNGGSIVGIGANLNGSIASQTPSPSGQFIVPANSKVGALATHV